MARAQSHAHFLGSSRGTVSLADRTNHFAQELVDLLSAATDQFQRINCRIDICGSKRLVCLQARDEIVVSALLLHDCGGSLAVLANPLVQRLPIAAASD